MSFGAGALLVQHYLQKIVPAPFFINLACDRVVPSKSYSKPFHKLFRYFCELSILWVILPLTSIRMTWLITHWESFTNVHIEQVVVYGGVINVVLIFVPVCYSYQFKSFELVYFFNQICQVRPFTQGKSINIFEFKLKVFRNKSIAELFTYSTAIPFLFLPVTDLVAPFVFPYLPIQLVLGQSFFVKLCSGIYYSSIVTYGGFCVLYKLLGAIVIMERIIWYTSSIYQTNYNRSGNTYFWPCYKRFRTAQLLVHLTNILYNEFLTTLTFQGVLLATMTSFAVLKMYQKMSVIPYMSVVFLSLLGYVVALSFTYVASIPYTRSNRFKRYWISRVEKRDDKKVLVSCKAFGFKIGPYGTVNAMLGIHICNEIIDNTVTILLLDGI